MSFFGTKDDAKKWANEATHIIDGETTTSPVRDGGTDVGGAPIATSIGGGPKEFTQERSRTGIQDHPVGTMVRQYGQQKKTSYK
jgi:hypothetical protein